MKRRTPEIKETMVRAIATAIQYLNHPDMPILPGNFTPSEIARFLRTDIDLLSAPGKIQEKNYIMDDLQIAADYLSHNKVRAMPFALNSSNIARSLREIIRDLK